jgi:hypothetical protein
VVELPFGQRISDEARTLRDIVAVPSEGRLIT